MSLLNQVQPKPGREGVSYGGPVPQVSRGEGVMMIAIVRANIRLGLPIRRQDCTAGRSVPNNKKK